MKFRDTVIRNLKPEFKRYIVREGDGFCLYVNPTGSKAFYYAFKVDGKQKQIKIGDYPAITLSEARNAHHELKRQRERGELEKETITFADLVTRYLNEFGKTYVDKGKEIRRLMDKDVLPVIGSIPITEIKKPHIYKVTTAVVARKAPRQANITLEKISVVFRYACAVGLLEANPCYAMPKAQENEPKSRTLTDAEIKQIWKAPPSDTNNILKLCLLTGCRPGEAQNLHHADIEANRKWWICKQIKGGRISLKRTYLTCTARSLVGAGDSMVFGGMNTQNGVAKYVKRKYNQGWTPHDIRRTVATRLAGRGYADERIHRLLGHSPGKLSRTYNVYRYDKEIREMLIVWAREVKRICSKPDVL